MIHPATQPPPTASPPPVAPVDTTSNGHKPTVWGLDAVALHDRFWAARGVQVVRRSQADQAQLTGDAELFLLTDCSTLCIFRLSHLVETLSWLKPRMMFVRLHNTRELGYRERVVTDDEDRFLRFERVYATTHGQLVRVGLTPDREVAQRWLGAEDSSRAWRELRHSIDPDRRTTLSVSGSAYNARHDEELMAFLRELVSVWKQPDSTITRAQRCDQSAWIDRESTDSSKPIYVGPVWIGSGRELHGVSSVVGPTVLWDDPDKRPEPDRLTWQAIEPTDVWAGTIQKTIRPKRLTSLHQGSKRIFDVVFSIAFLTLCAPLFVIVPLAIWLEDRGKAFFPHTRESKGGREFECVKFRTMKHNAEQIKAQLAQENQADGPQFFIENDPRHTKVGTFLRRFNIDEIPQFWNVLKGEMSVVGPRPSPRQENQYCPPWREARLSVRPGVTGLWQVERSREQGKDFQEWIRYDIEYVENLNWAMDLKIIFKTIKLMIPS